MIYRFDCTVPELVQILLVSPNSSFVLYAPRYHGRKKEKRIRERKDHPRRLKDSKAKQSSVTGWASTYILFVVETRNDTDKNTSLWPVGAKGLLLDCLFFPLVGLGEKPAREKRVAVLSASNRSCFRFTFVDYQLLWTTRQRNSSILSGIRHASLSR